MKTTLRYKPCEPIAQLLVFLTETAQRIVNRADSIAVRSLLCTSTLSGNLFKRCQEFITKDLARASRPAVKTLNINKSRDIIVDRLLKQCEEGIHSKCTGWAVLKKEISPIDANYFLKCTCTCHHNKKLQQTKEHKPKKTIKKKRKMKKKSTKKSKKNKIGKKVKKR
jgi:hypothetical protein